MKESQSKTAAIFREWLEQYGDIPIKIARLFAANPEDQRDLLQEMYLQLWRSIESFAGEAKVSTLRLFFTPHLSRVASIGQ